MELQDALMIIEDECLKQSTKHRQFGSIRPWSPVSEGDTTNWTQISWKLYIGPKRKWGEDYYLCAIPKDEVDYYNEEGLRELVAKHCKDARGLAKGGNDEIRQV